jgi:hypothetical protein
MPPFVFPMQKVLYFLPICYRKGFLSLASGGFPHFNQLVNSNPVRHIFSTSALPVKLSNTRGEIIFIHSLCSTLPINLFAI